MCLGGRQGGLVVSVDRGEMEREGLISSSKVGSIKIYNNLIAIEWALLLWWMSMEKITTTQLNPYLWRSGNPFLSFKIISLSDNLRFIPMKKMIQWFSYPQRPFLMKSTSISLPNKALSIQSNLKNSLKAWSLRKKLAASPSSHQELNRKPN